LGIENQKSKIKNQEWVLHGVGHVRQGPTSPVLLYVIVLSVLALPVVAVTSIVSVRPSALRAITSLIAVTVFDGPDADSRVPSLTSLRPSHFDVIVILPAGPTVTGVELVPPGMYLRE
jgi:hypothetical protein